MSKGNVYGTGPSDVNQLFLRELQHIPEWEKIKACIQCGTCSASCPTSWAMDYKPREVMGLFRAGMLDKVLRSNTVWLCASCYYCTVRCPSGIKLTDIMYVLRSLGIKHGILRPKEPLPALAKAFAGVVDRHGRNAEVELLARYYLSTNPLASVKQMGLGLNMFRHGRLPLLPKSTKCRQDLQKMLARLEQEQSE